METKFNLQFPDAPKLDNFPEPTPNKTILDDPLSSKRDKFKAKTKSQIIFVKDRPGHDFRYSLNSKKIFKTLRKLPKQNFEKSLIQTVKWYKENSSYIK